MPRRYSSADPLAEALHGLREGWSSAADRRRQREHDAMQREDRQFMREGQQRQRENQDYQLYGQQPVEAPPQIATPAYRGAPALPNMQEGGDPFAGQRIGLARGTEEGPGFDFGELRSIGLGRAPDPFRGALPGSYVSGAGFAPARRPQAPQPMPPQFSREMETDPAFAQVGEGRWIDQRETPDARARMLEEQNIARLEALYGGIGLDPGQSAAMAGGVPAGIAAPDPYGGRRDRDQYLGDLREELRLRREGQGYQPTTREEWLGDQEALAGIRARESGKTAGVSPTQLEVSLRGRILGAARALGGIEPGRTASSKRAAGERKNQMLSYFGFTSEEELHTAARQLGVPTTEKGGIDVEAAMQQRIDELLDQGLDEDAVMEALEGEGFFGQES